MAAKYNKQRLELIEHILHEVAPAVSSLFAVCVNGVLNKQRGTAQEARARGMLMLLLYKWHGFNVYEVGTALGRHRSTIEHGVDLAEEFMSSVPAYRDVMLSVLEISFDARSRYLMREYGKA